MKKRFKILSRTLFILFVAFFMGNVQAFEGDMMKDKGYKSYSPENNGYVYVAPSSSFTYDETKSVDENKEIFAGNIEKSEGLTIYATPPTQASNGNTIKGMGVEIAADGTQVDLSGNYVTFKKFLKIEGKDIDLKVELKSLTSTIGQNNIRIYVNEAFKNNQLLHRYLGFAIHNPDNASGTVDNFSDMVKVKIKLIDNETGEAYKNSKIILYYNDIDSEDNGNKTELIRFYDSNMNKSNVFIASSDSYLKINNDGIISSIGEDPANAGWYTDATKKISLIVKGNSPLQTNGSLEFGFGHYMDTMNVGNHSRVGQNDIQFLIPQSIEGSKTYASDSRVKDQADVVNVGDIIKYQITLNPQISTSDKVTVKLRDKLSKGLSYVSGTAIVGGSSIEPTISDDGKTLEWNIENFNAQTTVTYSVKVKNDYENNQVSNNAVAIVDEVEYKIGDLTNPLPSKKYAIDTPAGKDGATVKKDDVIKYSVIYKNTSDAKQKVKITDTLSKGLKYKKNSAKVGNDALEPTVTDNPDGTTTLVWEKEVANNTQEELTYSVDVIGGVSEVRNKAYLQYAKLKSGSTTEYDDYSEKIKLNELINPLDVDVPNTGVSSSVIFIIIGLMLMTFGIIVIRKNTKKSLN